MFEHMAFKGTDKSAPPNYTAEKAALAKVEEAYAAYDRERREPVSQDERSSPQLEKAWKAAIDDADKFVVPNEFGKIVDRAGGVGMNAFTDYRRDRLLLLAAVEPPGAVGLSRVRALPAPGLPRVLQGARRRHRRAAHAHREQARSDGCSSSSLAAAFTAHPYRRPTVGWMSDLQ